ncbi:hypothetical protein NDU88_006102 [Pleurodeles waltl]|uniref:Endonuclease/exonuclease/phosphatase domain-containing protein n=1 Tax=Pleurodeles waltl TaxID=8319 RepID=A0AAV7VNN6_PLEWA|nr:hypothetical protein NDU88_006102 [Pleurodeles waltl]
MGPLTGGSKDLIPNNSIVEESSLTKREKKRKRKAWKKTKGVQLSCIWKSFAKSNGTQSKESESTENRNKICQSRQIRAERPASVDNSMGEPSTFVNQSTSQQQSPKNPRSSHKQGSSLLHGETALRGFKGNRTVIRQCPEQGTQRSTDRQETGKPWEHNPQRTRSAHNMTATNQPAGNNKQILYHGYHPWSDDCTNSAAQKRIPGHQITQDNTASEENKLLFIPCYNSKGAFDILNRGTILKLINAILPLAHISTTELMTVEFTPHPHNKDKEATLTSLATFAIIDQILAHQETFSAWGIILQKLEPPRYPNLLVPQQKKGGSILKGAMGVETSLSSWDHITIVKHQSMFHPGTHQQIFIGTPQQSNRLEGKILMTTFTNGPDENPEYIHICSWNTHGLQNLVTDRAALSFLQQFEIIMLQETWCMEPIQISGYSGIDVSAKQPQKHGHPKGGLTTYCSTKINWVIKQIDLGIDWLLPIKLEHRAPSGNNRTLLLINVYIHPNKIQNSGNIETLTSILKMLQKQNKDAILIFSGDFNLDFRKGSTKHPNGTCTYIKFETLGLCCLMPLPEDASFAQVTFSSGTKKSNVNFTLINDTALPLVSAYVIQQRTESDHFPQLIKIWNEWNQLPTPNIIISAPVIYDTKKLKWKGPGLDKVMEEVYRSAGTTKELKEPLSAQELEDHPQGERVINWMHLCDSLINTFSIKKRLSIWA